MCGGHEIGCEKPYIHGPQHRIQNFFNCADYRPCMKKDKMPKGRILFCHSVKISCRTAARLGKYALIGDWTAVGSFAALRISHALLGKQFLALERSANFLTRPSQQRQNTGTAESLLVLCPNYAGVTANISYHILPVISTAGYKAAFSTVLSIHNFPICIF